MPAKFVILTGASGVGKTTIAQMIEDSHPEINVYQGDRIGLPSYEILAGYGHTDEPGGNAQRGFALYWIGVIAAELKVGSPVLLETQCRIAFLHEALLMHSITNAHIILLETSDAVREVRLHGRGQPELADEQMSSWSHYLHEEADELGVEIFDTTTVSLVAGTAHVLRYFQS